MSKLLALLVLITLLGAPSALARPIHDPPATPPPSSASARPDWQPLVTGTAGALVGALSVVALRRRRPQLAT
jgi:hypothetical protein